MIILPAIDIKDGQCVRLNKGVMDTAQQVAEDPLETAKSFADAGASWIHMVDLDGAISGRRINSDYFVDVARNSGLRVELGGGIRSMEDISFYLSRGIARVVLGSVALKNPELVSRAVQQYGERIAVGIDAKDGMVCTEGWVEGSSVDYRTLAEKMAAAGVSTIIFTDINRDGMLRGPNIAQLVALQKHVSCNIIASGGIVDIQNIQALTEIGVYGAICGRSIYAGTLDLHEAIQVGENRQ